MRCFLYILIAWLSLVASAADAAQVLLGVVTSVNRDQGRITLRVIDTSGNGSSPSPSESLVITADPEKIPGSCAKGDTLQVWGEYTGNGGRLSFRAVSIRMRGSGSSGSDPTGVRSRIGQGSGQGGNRRQSGRQ